MQLVSFQTMLKALHQDKCLQSKTSLPTVASTWVPLVCIALDAYIPAKEYEPILQAIAAPYYETYSTDVPIYKNYNGNKSIMTSLGVHFVQNSFSHFEQNTSCVHFKVFIYKYKQQFVLQVKQYTSCFVLAETNAV